MTDSLGAIFDMDGVIVHSNPAHKKSVEIFLEKYDLDVSEERLRNKLYGRTNKEWIPEIFDISSTETEQIARLTDEKERIFRELFEPEQHVVDGLYQFLNHLKSHGVPMAVATSAPRVNADYILSRLEIKSFFDLIMDSSHVDAGKPDPEVYDKTAANLGKAPDNCLVFEDSLSGIQAGLDSGAKVIGVTTTHTPAELAACHLVIDNFTDLTLNELSEISPVSS